jgi:hypothetical protein
MSEYPTAIERAFALAQSGTVENVAAIRKQLSSEGYSPGALAGGSLSRQLSVILAKARLAAASKA